MGARDGNGVAASKEEPPAEDVTADERARQRRERMAIIAHLKEENRNLRNLRQIVAEQLARVTPDTATSTTVTPGTATPTTAPEGYALVAVALANKGLSGFLELFVENEIHDLADVSVEDLVEVGVHPAAARIILSK